VKSTKAEIRAWVLGCVAGIYQPMPTETVWGWAERTLKIPRGGENDEMAGQPWSSDLSPYVRFIMDWFREPGKKEMFVRKSSQVGLTMAVLIVICWHIVHRPVNVGYCIDSVDEARKISKTRLKRWITENKLLDGVNESEDDLANLTYFLRSMTVYLMGSFSEGAFRNKALTIGILDELDAHPMVDKQGTTADNMRARLKRSKNSKLLGFSTPKEDTDQTTVEFEAGTQEMWYMPCPHCGTEQPFLLENLRFRGEEFEDLAGEPDMEVVKAHAYFECIGEMKCKISQGEKYEMLLKGRPVARAKAKMPNKRSVQLNDFYSNFCTWGELACQYLEAELNLEKMRAFYQQRLGLPFRQEGGDLREKDVLACRVQEFRRGTCPAKPVLTAVIADVQQSTMKWGKIVFDKDGNLWLVDWGETASWDVLGDVMCGVIHTAHGDFPVEAAFVDEGDGNRVKEVREFTMPHDHIFPVKGRGEGQIRELIWPSTSYQTGEEILTYHVNDNAYKYELVFGRILRGEKRRTYGKKQLMLPINITPEAVKEIMGERLSKVKNKYKQFTEKWIKTGVNDLLDILKYGLSMWDLMEPSLRDAGRLGDDG
jgi:phage terminase large subunit GpA-like protein